MPGFPRLLHGDRRGLAVAAGRGGAVRRGSSRSRSARPSGCAPSGDAADATRSCSARSRGCRAQFDDASGRPRRRAEVPPADDLGVRCCATDKRDRNARYAQTMVHTTLDRDGPRRHLRPARRRLRSATRSTRTGWCRTSRRCSTTTPSSPRSTCTPGRPSAMPSYRRVCEETLDYVLREMTDPAGGFYSAEDADSEGARGQVLRLDAGRDRARCSAPTPTRALALLGCGPRAELRGPEHSLRARPASPIPMGIAPLRRRLLARRASTACVPGATTRCWPPGTAWPAGRWPRRAARSAGRTTSRPPSRNAEFLLGQMRVDGRLLRTWKGGQARSSATSRTTRWWPPR